MIYIRKYDNEPSYDDYADLLDDDKNVLIGYGNKTIIDGVELDKTDGYNVLDKFVSKVYQNRRWVKRTNTGKITNNDNNYFRGIGGSESTDRLFIMKTTGIPYLHVEYFIGDCLKDGKYRFSCHLDRMEHVGNFKIFFGAHGNIDIDNNYKSYTSDGYCYIELEVNHKYNDYADTYIGFELATQNVRLSSSLNISNLRIERIIEEKGELLSSKSFEQLYPEQLYNSHNEEFSKFFNLKSEYYAIDKKKFIPKLLRVVDNNIILPNSEFDGGYAYILCRKHNNRRKVTRQGKHTRKYSTKNTKHWAFKKEIGGFTINDNKCAININDYINNYIVVERKEQVYGSLELYCQHIKIGKKIYTLNDGYVSHNEHGSIKVRTDVYLPMLVAISFDVIDDNYINGNDVLSRANAIYPILVKIKGYNDYEVIY